MTLPYSEATAGPNAIREVEKILAKFGCQSFGTMTDAERGVMIVAFKWRDQQVHIEASYKGYVAAWRKENPRRKDSEALDRAKIAICSVLRDWIKGQVTAVECGVLSFGAAFMPHMLLKDGRRVLDVAQTSGLLPLDPAEGGVARTAGKKMTGPQIVCASCGGPTPLSMPICAFCGGKSPKPFCALCESALSPKSPLMPADEHGFHHTREGGYAGRCAKWEAQSA